MKDQILDTISEFIFESQWGGACYASTAIAHTLLKSQGIKSIPCLGVVNCINGEFFDHAWLEIEGKIYDLAIPFPLSPESRLYDFVSDRFGIRGEVKPKNFSYGIDHNLDQEAQLLADDFSFIFKQSPFFNPALDYATITVRLGEALGLSISRESVNRNIKNSSWTIKRAS